MLITMFFLTLNSHTLLKVNAGEGHTWSEEVSLFDTPIDDRDAGIICISGIIKQTR